MLPRCWESRSRRSLHCLIIARAMLGLTRKGDKIVLWAAKPAHSCSTRGAKSDGV